VIAHISELTLAKHGQDYKGEIAEPISFCSAVSAISAVNFFVGREEKLTTEIAEIAERRINLQDLKLHHQRILSQRRSGAAKRSDA
jgi:hypothetical protein